MKSFAKKAKLLLSSLSARGCQFIYLNIPGYPDKMILSNANPDFLMTKSLHSLISIHAVEFKDSWLQTFRELFIPEYSPANIYIFRCNMILKALKNLDAEITARLTRNGNIILKAGNEVVMEKIRNDVIEDLMEEMDGTENCEIDDTSTEDMPVENNSENSPADKENSDKKSENIIDYTRMDNHISGRIIDFPYIGFILKQGMKIMAEFSGEQGAEYQQGHLCVSEEDILRAENIHANWYRTLKYKPEMFTTESPGTFMDISFLLMDGIDVPSIREFLKKQFSRKKNTDNAYYEFHIFASGIRAVRTMSVYGCDSFIVRTMRPFFEEMLVEKVNSPYLKISNTEEVYSCLSK